MNTANIITQFRTDAYVDSIQVPDATAIIWLNRAYRFLINEIRQKVNEDYFYNEWISDTVQNQREYRFLDRTASIPWMVKVKGISIKYKTTDTEYKKVRPETLSNLDRDLEWYSTNQSKDDPFFIISDNSVFIYPSPTEAVTWWIKFYWISDPCDLTTTSVEWDIKIPLEFHDLIPLGMMPYSYQARGMLNEKNNAKNEFLQETQRMISNLSDRIITPLESVMPDLSYYA